MKKKPPIKAVIFDLDGVLIDATEWHYDALNEALKVFGFEIQRSDHIGIYNGLPTAGKLKLLSEKHGLPEGLHAILKSLKRKYTDRKVNIHCAPSYEKQLLLTHLKKKYKLACCSNAQKYSVVNMLKMAEIDHFFDEILGNDEGLPHKPHPDIYLEAFKRLKVSPEEVAIVEDAPHGIAAAKASGALVIEVKGYEDVNIDLFVKAGILS